MSEDLTRLETELEKIRQAIEAQETLRGILPEAQLEATLASLRQTEASLRVQIGNLVKGDVAGDVVGQDKVGGDKVRGDKIDVKIEKVELRPDPAQARRSEARQRYLRRLRHLCQALPLAALGGEEGADEDLTLDRVYIELDTSTTILLRQGKRTSRKEREAALPDHQADQRPLTALEAAENHLRLALLGEPGAGKSAFTRRLLAWLASANLGESDPPPGLSSELLPILITLRDLAPRLAALDLAALPGDRHQEVMASAVRDQAIADLERLDATDFVDELRDKFTSGQCLLALDGLDEVPHDQRLRVRRATLWAGNIAVLVGREAIERDTGSPHGGPVYLERLIPRLVALLESDLPAPERAEAGRALAHLGDPRSGVGLRDDGLPDIVWCEVPAGPFLMGSDQAKDKDAHRDELPQHEVDLLAFHISQYSITNAQYKAFMEEGGYQVADYWTEAAEAGYWEKGQVKRVVTYFEGRDTKTRDEWAEAPAGFGHPFALANHPVVGINWWKALAFSRWLTDKLRQVGELGADKVIGLPSEREWEKAARGPDGRIYPWGDEPDPNRANYTDTGLGTTSAVSCFPDGAGVYECQDMSGNVWEWCRTQWQEDYGDYPDDDYLSGKGPRVARGGAFGNSGGRIRCAVRFGLSPYFRFINFGFRVAVVEASPGEGG